MALHSTAVMALDLLQLKHFLYIITVIGLLPSQAQQGSQDRNIVQRLQLAVAQITKQSLTHLNPGGY